MSETAANGYPALLPIIFSVQHLKHFISITSFGPDTVLLFPCENEEDLDLNMIINHLLKYFDEPLTNMQLVELSSIAFLMYTCDPKMTHAKARNDLLNQVFYFDVDQMQIDYIVHGAMEIFRIMRNFRFGLNILKYCYHSRSGNDIGPIIGINLAYGLICKLAQVPIDRSKQREFSYIIDVINLYDENKFELDDLWLVNRTFVLAIAFLLHALDTKGFEKNSSPENGESTKYIKYSIYDLKALRAWLEKFFLKTNNDAEIELHFCLQETITICKMHQMNLKIIEIEDGKKCKLN